MLRKPPFPYELYKNMPRLDLNIVTRQEWGAKPPTSSEDLSKFPVTNLVVGYTETEPCTTKESCMKSMRELQELHMSQGQDDIRYNFVIGEDGNIYEGRGTQKKAGRHHRFPDLAGENYEIVHTGQRGGLPDPGWSSLKWQFLDKLEYDGLLDYKVNYFLDYEDDYPPVDIESLEIDTEANVLENLKIN